jgi:hypothetical protein
MRMDRIADEAAAEWTMDAGVAAALGHDLEVPTDWDSDEATRFIGTLTARFADFRERFFLLPNGRPYATEGFHRAWIAGILRAIFTGSRHMILSPPRHGKSELLVHFCVWLICRDPNVRIMWVAGNTEIASDMVTLVRLQLEENGPLLEAVLPPNQTFRPTTRGGTTWTNSRFKVANRTAIALKASTMVAIGRNGKILSRDADFIVCDDIEDDSSVNLPSARSQTRNWVTTTLESRKEDHTGFVIIGSRQHPDDLYSYLLDDPLWSSRVDAAHDPACTEDPGVPEAHGDCMLFGSHRSYEWLLGKKRSAQALGLEGVYEMVYLNSPRPEGILVFDREVIETTYDLGRDIGFDGVPPDRQIVAGLDPSATGYQSGFCWAWSQSEGVSYMVDLDNHLGGGIDVALALFRDWLDAYNVHHWVIEENGFQRAIRADPKVREWASDSGVYLEGHQTQGFNKLDDNYGVGAMMRLFREGKVNLPYGTSVAREKVNLYTHQMVHFSDDVTKRNRSRTDVLMASWFPTKVIRRWQKEFVAQMSVTYEPSFLGYDTDRSNTPPW